MAVKINIRTLLEAGCHYGHQTRRWNPKMKPFIFGERNGIYILDLKQTVLGADKAYSFLKDTAAKGGRILFVGTKKQAQEPIAAQAERCGMPYINQRWLGGMLTNFVTMRSRIDRMEELEAMVEDGRMALLPKKEQAVLGKELEKLQRNLGGARELYGIPANDDAIRSVNLMCELVADAVLAGTGKEQISVEEMSAGETTPAVEVAEATEAPAAE